MSARPRLSARDVDDLRFSVRADSMANSESSRLEDTVERILAEHIDPLEEQLDEAQVESRRLRRELRDCRDGA